MSGKGCCSSVIVHPVWARAPCDLLVKRQRGGADAFKSEEKGNPARTGNLIHQAGLDRAH